MMIFQHCVPLAEVIMARFPLPALAFITVLTLAVSPAIACERHMDHTAVVVPAPAPVPAEPSKTTGVLISPAAAAAMSVTEALGTEPYDMRCPRMRRLEQALTQ
jgi:hypothetical protein